MNHRTLTVFPFVTMFAIACGAPAPEDVAQSSSAGTTSVACDADASTSLAEKQTALDLEGANLQLAADRVTLARLQEGYDDGAMPEGDLWTAHRSIAIDEAAIRGIEAQLAGLRAQCGHDGCGQATAALAQAMATVDGAQARCDYDAIFIDHVDPVCADGALPQPICDDAHLRQKLDTIALEKGQLVVEAAKAALCAP